MNEKKFYWNFAMLARYKNLFLSEKSSSQLSKTDNGFKFDDPENLRSNFIKLRYFPKKPLPYVKNQAHNYQKPTTDSDSSTPKTFDQTL